MSQQLTFTFVTLLLAMMPAALETVQICVAGWLLMATEYVAPAGWPREKTYEPFAAVVKGSVPLFVRVKLPANPEMVPPTVRAMTQLPATHRGVAPPHATGQEPQWSRLVWVLTHSTPQAVVPPLQMS
jgi:hypothetical protein